MSKIWESIEKNVNEIVELEEKKKWSKKIKEKWQAPEGFFEKSATSIAKGLKAAHEDKKSAMSSLNFYINRAGKKLEAKDKERLELAKEKLETLYPEVKK